MTTISPTPFATSSVFGNPRSRHTTSRSLPRPHIPRPVLKRNIQVDNFQGHGFNADAPMLQSISYGDSSDDEMPQPMAFSALTKAILEGKASSRDRSPEREERYSHSTHSRHESARSAQEQARSDTATPPSRGALRISPKSMTPPAEAQRVSPPRVVHLSGPRQQSSGLRRSASSAEIRRTEDESSQERARDHITPAPAPRRRPAMRSRANSSSTPNEPASIQERSSSARSQGAVSSQEEGGAVSSYGASFAESGQSQEEEGPRSQSRSAGDAAPGSLRHKRLNIGSGTFLRGAPMRRPLRRRQSEEDQSPRGDHQDEIQHNRAEHNAEAQPRSGSRSNNLRPPQQHVEVQDFAPKEQNYPYHHRQAEDLQASAGHEQRRVPSTNEQHQSSLGIRPPSRSREKPATESYHPQPVFKIPVPPVLPSYNDEENEAPPTFKRNKPGVLSSRGKIHIHEEPDGKMLVDTPAIRSPKRQALAPKSINTPQRAAPPPPKMSVLETATAVAGASTVKSKKKRTHVTVNGKIYSLRGRIGRGGSSDVYRVMSENEKMFALKKVNLEDCNEDTVRGYKGEIELLKKLENVDRVVRLYDWEVLEQKQSLSVLMEIGESDLNRLLSQRIALEDSKLDLNFTRHYWREMLSCVAAVHEYDIVHSDLKPANFLLVQGSLKLIDFGIANAIDTDHTVNVHRETNVGTPNYMSPESLQDTNAGSNRAAGTGAGVSKLMKLGKPSDVWSLGCILYQMTYGKPPFAHIQNQWNRVMAIINPAVTIIYPTTGVGGAQVPSCLRWLLKSCLNRDASQRPSIAQLLDDREAFMHPDRAVEELARDEAVPMSEALLEQILGRVVERCKDPKRGCPSKEEMRVYSGAFLERVRELKGLPPPDRDKAVR